MTNLQSGRSAYLSRFFRSRSRFLSSPARIVHTASPDEQIAAIVEGRMSSVARTHGGPEVGYVPAWRRPIAGGFRGTAHGAVRFCVAHGIHADSISYASIGAAALAGLCFWRAGDSVWLLLVAPLFCYVRLWLNMLDGMVALASGHASPRGEILNDLPDRISDVLIFVGVAHSGLVSPFSGYWAAIFALLTAYVGTLGQAVGVQREFSGPMSKPWRMAVLHAGAWCAAAATWLFESSATSGLTLLDYTCLLVVLGCVQTIAIRLTRILEALDAQTTGVGR
jgi:phosphatidylglycerophosphate synthase